MIKRTVEISTAGTHLTLRDGQMVVRVDNRQLGSVPVEDLGVLILDSRQVTLSSGLLDSITGNGGVVLVCDETHLPSGILVPTAANTVQTERIRRQVEMGEPLRKQLWMRIVVAKIRAQAGLLRAGGAGELALLHHAKSVRSGDPENREAQAARLYWSTLFADVMQETFRRDPAGAPPNGLLNYGYAILRAGMARAVCAAGLHPSIGIHHSNRYNPFCLADDLLEPYRPFVDRTVRQLVGAGLLDVTKETKKVLLELLAESVGMGSDRSPMLIALQRTAASLAHCLEEVRDEGGGSRSMDQASRLSLPLPPRPAGSIPEAVRSEEE